MATEALQNERLSALNQLVRQWDRRWRVHQAVIWLPRCLLPGLALGIGVAVISRLQPWLMSGQILTIALIGLAAGLVGLAAAMILWPRPLVAAARRFDLMFGLQERVSTALELLDGRIRANEELMTLQVDDAWVQARVVRASESLPLVWRWREWGIVVAAALVLAILLVLPNPTADAIGEDAAQQAALNAAAEELKQITEEIASDTTLTPEERQQLLQALETSLDTLEQPEISPEEAFATLSEARSALQEQADDLTQRENSRQEALNEAGEALSDYEPPQSPDQQSQIQEVPLPQLDQLAAAMNSMTPEQMQAAAANLDQAAEAMQESNPEAAEAMRQAAEALRQGDTAEAQEALEQASAELQEAAQASANQQQTSDQLNQSSERVQQAANDISEQSQSQSGDQSQPGEQGEPGEPGQQGEQQGESGEPGEGQPGQQGEQQGEGQTPGSAAAEGEEGGQPGQPGQGAEGQTGTEGEQSQDSSADGAGAGAGDTQGGDGSDSPSGVSSPEEITPDNNPDGQGEGQFESVYAPQRLNQSGEDEIILEPDSSNAPVQQGEFAVNPTGNVTVPYNQVFSDYSDAVNEALESDYIPLGLRDVVRDYFSSLEPGQRGR